PLLCRPLPRSALVPYTTLFRSRVLALVFPVQGLGMVAESLLQRELRFRCVAAIDTVAVVLGYGAVGIALALCGFAAWSLVGAYLDRKSTRLNSSHQIISYAVFC